MENNLPESQREVAQIFKVLTSEANSVCDYKDRGAIGAQLTLAAVIHNSTKILIQTLGDIMHSINTPKPPLPFQGEEKGVILNEESVRLAQHMKRMKDMKDKNESEHTWEDQK